MKRSSNIDEDVTIRQQKMLNQILSNASASGLRAKNITKVSIADARHGEAHFEVASERETIRLLFISQDTSLLNQTTQTLDGYLNLSEVFDEVHILILQKGIPVQNPVLRVAPNVWLYVVSAPSMFSYLAAAKETIQQQLLFAEGFRADLIVARDPFASGSLALWAHKRYERPAQLHILEDYTQARSFVKFSHARLMKWWFWYVVRQFSSVRTPLDSLTKKIQEKFPYIRDVETLPRFYNIQSLLSATDATDIKDKYQQFSFIVLYIGSLHFGSKAFQAIDGVRTIMRSKKVGLVVIGDGEARAEFMKRAQLLGIGTQVVFEKKVDDIQSYLTSADVLVVPETSETSDELIVKGAIAGIPLVVAESPTRLDLLTPEQSALFFGPDNVTDMSEQLKKVLNDPVIRKPLTTTAQATVIAKIHEDPLTYQLQYRDSVEAALFTEDSQTEISS